MRGLRGSLCTAISVSRRAGLKAWLRM